MYKYTKYSYEEFILRLRSIENKKNDRQLALAMELRPDTLAQMKIRSKIPFESVIGYCEKTGYSMDKLFLIEIISQSLKIQFYLMKTIISFITIKFIIPMTI